MTDVANLPKAVITVALDAPTLVRLSASCQPIVVSPSDRGAVLDALGDAEGLMGSALFPIDTELFDRAPRLRVVSNFGVGYNNVDPAEATRRGVAVCNTPGVLTAAVADLTLGLILAASRRIPTNSVHVASGAWTAGSAGPSLGFDLQGKTLGIVGYGRIGKAAAQRARAFGMNVVFNDLFTESPDGTPYRALEDLLAESDVVSIHTNLTPASRHLIGAAQLARMKPSAWIVNTARGPVIDEVALAAALTSGQIAGAALDVMEVEPPPAGSPILSAPNAILLPHVGSGTVETRAAMLDLCLRNFMAVLACERPPECVNPEALERALVRRKPDHA